MQVTPRMAASTRTDAFNQTLLHLAGQTGRPLQLDEGCRLVLLLPLCCTLPI